MFPFLLSPSTFSCLVYFFPCFIGHAMGEGRYPCAPGATPLASPTKLTITHLKFNHQHSSVCLQGDAVEVRACVRASVRAESELSDPDIVMTFILLVWNYDPIMDPSTLMIISLFIPDCTFCSGEAATAVAYPAGEGAEVPPLRPLFASNGPWENLGELTSFRSNNYSWKIITSGFIFVFALCPLP